jgi:hypothetical protein
MKRYIQSSKTKKVDIDTSMFKGTPFQCYTGMSYYDDFLSHKELDYKQSAKNRTGEIVLMSPEEYYRECSHYGFSKYVPVVDLKMQRRFNTKLVEKYKKMMRNGTKFCLCVLNKADHTQEGLHRMMAAGDVFGWDKLFPVLVVTPYDQAVEDRWNLISEMNQFKDDKFEKYCQWASRNISDYKSPVPDNFKELYREAIVQEAKDLDKDIDVEVEVVDDGDYHYAKVYLTRYKTYEPEYLTEPVEIDLNSLFDTEGFYSNNKSDNDDDISGLLFI